LTQGPAHCPLDTLLPKGSLSPHCPHSPPPQSPKGKEKEGLTCSHSPWRGNENSTHVENHCSVDTTSRMCPSVCSLMPALDRAQDGCPPCPLKTGGLEKSPYAHSEAEAAGEEGTGHCLTLVSIHRTSELVPN
jgi:hypothetical protein